MRVCPTRQQLSSRLVSNSHSGSDCRTLEGQRRRQKRGKKGDPAISPRPLSLRQREAQSERSQTRVVSLEKDLVWDDKGAPEADTVTTLVLLVLHVTSLSTPLLQNPGPPRSHPPL